MDAKECSKCSEVKPLSEYYTNGRLGRQSKCRQCWRVGGINGYQGELRRRFCVDHDENVLVCGCGRYFTRFKYNKGRRIDKERAYCSICTRESR